MKVNFLCILFCLYLLCSCSNETCLEYSGDVAYARSLSKERLIKLYYDMEEFSKKTDTPFNGFKNIGDYSNFPDEFSDLKVVRVRPDQNNIMIQGYLDHYVYMHFYGYGVLKASSDEPSKYISVSCGEYPVYSEILWQEN